MEIKCVEADNEEKDDTIPRYVKLLKLFIKVAIPKLGILLFCHPFNLCVSLYYFLPIRIVHVHVTCLDNTYLPICYASFNFKMKNFHLLFVSFRIYARKEVI